MNYLLTGLLVNSWLVALVRCSISVVVDVKKLKCSLFTQISEMRSVAAGDADRHGRTR